MIDVLTKVLALFTPAEKRRAYVLFGMVLTMAVLDVVGVASIMPFMSVLANPDLVASNPWLKRAYEYFAFQDVNSFLFALGVVVFIAMSLSITFRAITTWAMLYFAQMRHYAIARRMVAGYLRQPYEWYLNQHSADLGKMVLSEVQMVVVGSLVPLIHVLAQGAVVAAMVLLLVAVDPLLALIVGGGFGGAYAFTFTALRGYLNRIGKDRVVANAQRFKALSESFGGIKEVKLAGLEDECLERFDDPAKRFARTQAIASIVGAIPRYVLELFGFGAMLLLLLTLVDSAQDLNGVLPVIAVYAVAGYRIMPALQTAYANATKLRFAGEALDKLHESFASLGLDTSEPHHSSEVLVPQDEIRLESINYKYPGADRPALKDFDAQIPVNSTTGIVGRTGSGKSTVVDILLGLLRPGAGRLTVDGISIASDNVLDWQRAIGYVPQQIFLADESIRENIAFGVNIEDIDDKAVERAAKAAQLHHFVINELDDAYATQIGERGVRLSGGQRQRIGLARAIYHSPAVLILDEATSALDADTEQRVMDSISKLRGEITIVIVAHRLSTLKDCDKILVLDEGRKVEECSYNDIIGRKKEFGSNRMAGQ